MSKQPKQKSPLDELRESNIDVWEMIGRYEQPSSEDLAQIVKEQRMEREDWEQKQDEKEA